MNIELTQDEVSLLRNMLDDAFGFSIGADMTYDEYQVMQKLRLALQEKAREHKA